MKRFRKTILILFLLGMCSFLYLKFGNPVGKNIEFSYQSANLYPRDTKLLWVGSSKESLELARRTDKKCKSVHIKTRVIKGATLEWHERHELHGEIRSEGFDLILIELSPLDFRDNVEIFLRFDKSSKRAGSRIVYWSMKDLGETSNKLNFMSTFPKDPERVCSEIKKYRP